MKKIFSKLAMLVIGGVAIIGAASLTQNEAKAMSLSLSPMKQSVVLVPGERYEGSIKVSNPAGETDDLHYIVRVNPYSVKAEDGSGDDYSGFDISEITSLNEIVNWTTLENAEGVLKPNETAVVKFIVDVPEDAPAGGQYAVLTAGAVKDANGSDDEGLEINELWQMNSKIYAEVMGTTIEKATISANEIPNFLLDGKLVTSSLVSNEGNVHTAVKNVLQVWPMGSDEEICTNEETEDENEDNIVLPNTKKYSQESCTLPSPGIYKVKQTVKIFGEESVAEATIIYCPIWLMLVIIFGIILIVIWLVMMVRSRRKKAA